MREPTFKESNGDVPSLGVMGDAVWRLDQSLAKLEARLADRPGAVDDVLVERAASQAVALEAAEAERMMLERAKADLTAELETAREREMALMDVAAAASEALGRAGAEVRAALGITMMMSEEEAA